MSWYFPRPRLQSVVTISQVPLSVSFAYCNVILHSFGLVLSSLTRSPSRLKYYEGDLNRSMHDLEVIQPSFFNIILRIKLRDFLIYSSYLSLSGSSAFDTLEKCILSPDGDSMAQYSIGVVKRLDVIFNAFPFVGV